MFHDFIYEHETTMALSFNLRCSSSRIGIKEFNEVNNSSQNNYIDSIMGNRPESVTK